MLRQDYPFFLKSSIILLGLVLFFTVLSYGREIFVPLAFSALLAVLLNPIEVFLEKRLRIHKIVAISLAVLLAIILFGVFFYVLSSQLGFFVESFPRFKEKFSQTLLSIQKWISSTFGITIGKQIEWLNQGLTNISSNVGSIAGTTLSTITGFVVMLTLLPVYVFLFLFYRVLITEFLVQIFSKGQPDTVREIIHETKSVMQKYVTGLIIEVIIVAILNVGGLLLIGVDYAILFGLIGAVFNLVPYIGIFIAGIFPVAMALVDGGIGAALAVIALYSVVQFIDNNIIVPKVVGSKVQLNALVSIITLLIGGALWGISGMFLALPFTAVLKIIFDRVETMKPWGMLLGDEIPGENRKENFLLRKFAK